MRVIKLLVKLILFLAIIIPVICAGSWYYFTGKVVDVINSQYAGKKIDLSSPIKASVSFDHVKATGFPFEIALEVYGWKEETPFSETQYKLPIKVGYNLLSQNLFASYDGEINSFYKPAKHNFGARLDVRDYLITLSVPLSKSLLSTATSMKDPFELINHIGALKASTGKVEIFDLNSKEKFYDKEHEAVKLSFVSDRKYSSLNDFLTNIPGNYKITYSLKSSDTGAVYRKVPVNLFYGFIMIPSGMSIGLDVNIQTKAIEFAKIAEDVLVTGKLQIANKNFELPSSKFEYKSQKNSGRILVDSKVRLEKGFFDRLFDSYNSASLYVRQAAAGEIVDREIRYIIANKDVFKFSELEDITYDINLDLSSSSMGSKTRSKIDNLSIFSPKSGFRLRQEANVDNSPRKTWDLNGLLFIKNYPAVVEFSSGYIYRFGKFKFLNDEARNLYIDVNKSFLRKISDHPDSDSEDLSVTYSVDSSKLFDAKIGTTTVSQIAALYQAMLYGKLLGKVGLDGDVLERMRKIVPDIDPNSPILKQLIPADKLNVKEVSKKVEQEVKKEINKILPEDSKPVKDLGKKLLKGLTK